MDEQPDSTRHTLLREIENFVNETGVAVTTLGREAVSDPSVVARLRSGRSCTIETYDRLRGYMAGKRQQLANTPGKHANAV